jgi:hypothetical protein
MRDGEGAADTGVIMSGQDNNGRFHDPEVVILKLASLFFFIVVYLKFFILVLLNF